MSAAAAATMPAKSGFATQIVKSKREIIAEDMPFAADERLNIWHWNVNGIKLVLKRN